MASGFFGKLFRSKKTKKNKDKFVENEDQPPPSLYLSGQRNQNPYQMREDQRPQYTNNPFIPTSILPGTQTLPPLCDDSCSSSLMNPHLSQFQVPPNYEIFQDHHFLPHQQQSLSSNVYTSTTGVEHPQVPVFSGQLMTKAKENPEVDEQRDLNMRLWSAAEENRISDIQQSLKDGANIEFKNPDLFNSTPLLVASIYGHEEAVKVLVDSKADVSAVDEDNRTALHYASTCGHEGVTKILLENGCDLAAVDKFGSTPLHVAKTKDVATVLIEAGASVTAVNNEGDTAFHKAATHGRVGVLSLLVSADKTLLQATNKNRRTPISILKESPTENVLAQVYSDERKKCLEMLKSEFNIDDSSIKDTPDLPTSSAHEDEPMKEDTHARNSDQLEEVSFNEKGLFHHSHEYGVTIIIPEGAVQGPATLQFGASLLLAGFKCEGPYEPVSPFVWIHTDPALSKPAELYVPHYAMADTAEDRVKLYLLTRGHEENAVFKVNNKLEASISTALIRISGTHFCTVCLGSTPVPKRRYLIVYATKELEDGTVHVDVSVLYSFRCLQMFKQHYVEGYKVFQEFAPFTSGDVRIEVQLPKNSDWEFNYREFQLEYIKEDRIDFYQLLGCTPESVSDHVEAMKELESYEKAGLYPPRVKFEFTPICFPTSKCQAKIVFYGHDNQIPIPIQLRGLSSPSPAISSSPADSGYGNTALNNPPQLLEANTTNDFVINIMSFLESRLTTDYIKFGHHLGLDMDSLHHIEESTGHDMKRCMRLVLFQWWKRSPDASHESVAKALKASRYDLLSAMVTLRYSENQSATFCTICQKNHGPEISDYDLLNHILGDSDILKTEPELADLMSLIGTKIPAKWELFGAQLNIQQSRMDALGTENPKNCDLCFQHLFDVWKRTRSSPVTWLTVIKALHSITEYVLAENVYRQITT